MSRKTRATPRTILATGMAASWLLFSVGMPAWGSSVGADAAGSTKAAASTPGPRDITDPRQDGLIRAQSALEKIFDRHRQSYGGSSWDMTTQVLTIRVVGSVEDADSDAGLLANEVRVAALPVTVSYATVPRSRAELEVALQEIVGSKDVWAAGLNGFSYGRVSETDGSVVIGVDAREVSRWSARAQDSTFPVPVVVRGEAKIGVVYESRVDDYAPWTGGLNLDGSVAGQVGAGVVT